MSRPVVLHRGVRPIPLEHTARAFADARAYAHAEQICRASPPVREIGQRRIGKSRIVTILDVSACAFVAFAIGAMFAIGGVL